jgi:hypothetical protein
MMFVAVRQFASASGLEELKTVPVRLPSGGEIAPDGTTVYPATVWTFGAQSKLLVLPGYFVSMCGSIWSRNQGGSLKEMAPNSQVHLYIDGEGQSFLVHRIVASTFLSGIRHAGQIEVDHIDIKRENNALSNLRWATTKQNASNKCSKRKKETYARLSDLFSQAVQQLDKDGSVIVEFPSLVAATAALGCSKNCISNCVTGRSSTARGFAWRLSPPEMTLDEFRSRGFDVVGGIEEAPNFYFSSDLKVYHDGIGKMYEIPVAHGHVYPVLTVGGSQRKLHVVVAALRGGYKSLAAYDEFCATRLRDDDERVVVMHDGDEDVKDWWSCGIGTQKENALDRVRNTTGRGAAWAVTIRLSPDPQVEVWKYDGVRDAVFASFAEAGRVLAIYSDLKVLEAGIAQSVRTGCSFSLARGKRAWASVKYGI